MSQPVVLLTDFGTQDSYVGVMKGVIAGIAPDARVIDLSHEIRPQDLAHAAYTLRIAAPYFPDGTIFCCVVDPGVGSARRYSLAAVGDNLPAGRTCGLFRRPPTCHLPTLSIQSWSAIRLSRV